MRKAARLIKNRRVEILFCGNRIALPRVVVSRVARLKLPSIEMKLIEHPRTLAAIPAVGQPDSADIEEDYVEGEHRRLSRQRSVFRKQRTRKPTAKSKKEDSPRY